MEKTITNVNVEVNEEGFLKNFDQWNPDVARAIATEEDIELTEDHWEVIRFIQDQYKQEIPLTIRKVGKSGVIDIKGFYALFPGGPLKKASKIAGIPKPVSCI